MASKNYEEMMTAPVGGLILKLSIPAIISNLISNIYNLVDTYFVGTLGVSASGAVGIVFTLMAILQAVAFMLGQGAGTNISMRLADKDEKDASKYASTSIFMTWIVGTVFLVFGIIFLKPFMYLLGSTDTILPYAESYGFYILLSAPAIMSSLAMNNIFRYEGKTYLGMIGLSTGGILNMAMDPLFIYGFKLGIAGAGLSTCISQYISLIILLVLFFKKSVCKLSFSNFIHGFYHMPMILKNGFPSLIRQGLGSISSGVLNNAAKVFGDTCVSAMSIVSRVQGFMFSVGLGFGQGFQPVSGFNYQAKKYQRLRKAFTYTILVSFSVFLVTGTVSMIFAEYIIDLFIDSEEVVKIGSLALRMNCVGILFLPLSTSANMLFQSTGQSLKASFLACLRGGICFLPFILILPNLYGILGIQMSTGLGDITAGLLSLPFFMIYFHHLPKTDAITE